MGRRIHWANYIQIDVKSGIGTYDLIQKIYAD